MFLEILKTGFSNLFAVFRLGWRKRKLQKIRNRLHKKLETYYLSVGTQVVNRPDRISELSATAQEVAEEVSPLQQKLDTVDLQIAALDSPASADDSSTIEYLPPDQAGISCPKCQSQIPSTSHFCPACGIQIAEDVSQTAQEESAV